MNWDAIGAIAETLGAVGVIASLVYLATQIRHSRDQMSQNTRALRVGTYQQFREEIRASHSNIIPLSEARVMRLGLADPDQLNEDEAFQFTFWMHSVMPAYENAYYLHRSGMLDDDRWEMQRRILVQTLASPGVLQFWRTNQPSFSPEFTALVEEILAEEPDRGE
jgi:hypothetical protein